jgi:16S rRNA (cytidine1402-2'-O)-methyltransferase
VPPFFHNFKALLLTLIATPIGNLADITLRALEALREADTILCEDTRRSSILLKHYGIEKPLLSHHLFNEAKSLEGVLARLRTGERLALISDAGTPCLNDPGALLVAACIQEGLPFTTLPGPCSPIAALLLSNFDATRFQFVGFLPKEPKKTLRSLLYYPGTTVAFESPERLVRTLEALTQLDPKRRCAVAREMTKTYEECKRGSAEELLTHFQAKGVKGEICLILEGGPLPEEPLPLEELVQMLQELHGLSLKEAIKMAARLSGTAKSEVYKIIHK